MFVDRLLNRYFLISLLVIFLSHLTFKTMQEKSFASFKELFLYLLSILLAYLVTHYKIIPALIKINIRQGLFGKDIYLKGTPDFDTKIAECLGIGCAVAFFGHMLFMYAFFRMEEKAYQYEIISHVLGYIVFGTFLGFVDDVLELRWRDKLVYPFMFSILIIFNYEGDTRLHFPLIIEELIGIESINLSWLFYLYLILICIFCVNSINIYAGISGLEVGQSFIIGLTMMIESLYCYLNDDAAKQNMMALLILGPFCAVSFSLLRFNKVEAKTFVGDTYCYFAGCVLAACGIISKSPIKLLFFFIPQLFNFILSLPQLFGYVFCPRHRLPKMDLKTKKMHTTFPTNLNLVNFMLYVTGPLNEQQLGNVLLALQVLTNSIVIMVLRYLQFKQ